MSSPFDTAKASVCADKKTGFARTNPAEALLADSLTEAKVLRDVKLGDPSFLSRCLIGLMSEFALTHPKRKALRLLNIF